MNLIKVSVFAQLLMTQLSLSQGLGVVDLFPLSKGNQSTYQYYAYYEETDQWAGYVDSGRVSLAVSNFISQGDSIRWLFEQRRNIQRRSFSYGMPQTFTVIIDTAVFEVVEQLSGLHRLYRNATEFQVWNSVLPWSYQLTDTTMVFRYGRPDSSGAIRIRASRRIPDLVFTMTFQRGVGQVSAQCVTKFAGFSDFRTNHVLLSSVITAVPSRQQQSQPTLFTLEQNYPNPFNSTSIVALGVTSRIFARVSIFGLLGQEVSVLYDGWLEPGVRLIRWDAGLLPSGVYVYRMTAGELSFTRKALLLR